MALPTVLVIEDDPTVARALRRALEVQSVACEIAGSAKEVREIKRTFKLAIVDVNLPDGNGIDLYDELLSEKRVGAGIFFTATDDEQDKQRATLLGPVIPKSEGVEAAVNIAIASLQRS
jgi:DNA-binding response OmpR family regulator